MMIYPPQAPWAMPAPPTPAPATSEEGPAPRAPRGFAPDRYARIAGVVIVAITLAALALAVIGPALASVSSAIPVGWTTVYDSTITSDGSWENSSAGCAFTPDGLDVSAGSGASASGCAFQPSRNRDLTSQGVFVRASVAPAASVKGNQVAAITLVFANGTVTFAVDQEGHYELCLPDGSLTCPSDATVAWHEDGFVANTLALRYINGIVTGYANGQQVVERSVDLTGQATIFLNATRGDEALFTHATIYSGSGG